MDCWTTSGSRHKLFGGLGLVGVRFRIRVRVSIGGRVRASLGGSFRVRFSICGWVRVSIGGRVRVGLWGSFRVRFSIEGSSLGGSFIAGVRFCLGSCT